LWPAFIAPVVIGFALFLRGWRDTQATGRFDRENNPLQFKNALQLAVVFQIVMFAVTWARQHFGQQGIVGSAFILGAFEVDALTISMAQLTKSGTPAHVAAQAVTVGVLANTLVKLSMALALGRGRFRPLAAAGLAFMALALAAWVWWR
jgi:uncharacterized membrane protein (DUF4010 family)